MDPAAYGDQDMNAIESEGLKFVFNAQRDVFP